MGSSARHRLSRVKSLQAEASRALEVRLRDERRPSDVWRELIERCEIADRMLDNLAEHERRIAAAEARLPPWARPGVGRYDTRRLADDADEIFAAQVRKIGDLAEMPPSMLQSYQERVEPTLGARFGSYVYAEPR